MVDLGTHTKEYNGERNTYRKVYLCWELDEKKESGEPHIIGRDYTLSFADSAALRKMIEKWSGKKYAPGEKPKMTALLGKACLLSVAHSQNKDGSRTYANVDLVAPLPKAMTALKPSHKPFFWDVTMPGEPPSFDWLPFLFGEPLADWIKRSPEWLKRTEAQQTAKKRKDELDEAIPVTADDVDAFPYGSNES